MKKMNQQGFSLVELMVVVAIIGILSAVAIPQYQKFQAKSRQSEGKSALGGLYTAQAAFDSEWGQFYGDFEDIGLEVQGDLYYNYGFTAAGVTSPNVPEYNGARGPNGAAVEFDANLWNNDAATDGNPGSAVFRGGASAIPAAATIAATTFIANAVGNVDNDAALDYWSINQSKQLRNCSNPSAPGTGCTAAELGAAASGSDLVN